ncbi:MAG TPA: 3-phosphoshikimate 1-carboxyvinyltransferase [Candidatus Limnocylindrales bacterium]
MATGNVVEVAGARALRGAPSLPGDKSISHRALLLALLADGRSAIKGASEGADVRTTAAVIERLGAQVQRLHDGALIVDSGGLGALRGGRDRRTLDCQNAGTTLRLLAGILAGVPGSWVLDGDASLRGRPMARVAEPLRAMGAGVGASATGTPPLQIEGRSPLRAIDWTPAVASAQVKSAILLAGLRAEGTTRVHEPTATRDHTERMLRARGVIVRSRPSEDGFGAITAIEGGQDVLPRDEAVPGDASAAAFWLVAGAAHPDAALGLTTVGTNPGRRGAIDLLVAMGASLEERAVLLAADDTGEPAADLRVRSAELHGIDIDPRLAAVAIDEIPVLAVAATQARGTTTFRGVGELRVKESDRLAGIVEGLTALGAKVSVAGDDVRVVGPTPLRGAALDGRGDHRLVMAFAVAGLLASGTTSITGAASAAISDPGFFSQLERIRS